VEIDLNRSGDFSLRAAELAVFILPNLTINT
jgi:hypothetical protein